MNTRFSLFGFFGMGRLFIVGRVVSDCFLCFHHFLKINMEPVGECVLLLWAGWGEGVGEVCWSLGSCFGGELLGS